MAQLVLGLAGAAVGFAIGGPAGAQIGFAAGSAIGASLGPHQQVQGPRLSDLKAPSATYGSPIPYIEGHPRLAGVWAWSSDKREISNTTTAGGKGGQGVDSTNFTYEMDVLIILTEGRFEGIRRVWSNGKLVWTASDESDDDSLVASSETPAWREMRVMKGDPTQLPDPTYEAAFGVGNVPAMRDRGCVFIEGLNLGSSGEPPILTFEAGRAGLLSTTSTKILDATLLRDLEDTVNPTSIGAVVDGTVSQDGSGTVLSDFETKSNSIVLFSSDKVAAHYPGLDVNISVDVEITATVGSDTGPLIQRFFTYSNGPDEAHFAFHLIDGSVHLLAMVYHFGPLAIYDLGSAPPSANYRITFSGDGEHINFFVNDNLVVSHDAIGKMQDGSVSVWLAFPGETLVGGRIGVDKIRAKNLLMYTGSRPITVTTLAVDDALLAEVVLRQCERAGLDDSQVDVTDLAGKTVRALAVSQLSSPRTVIETLMAAFFFEAVESDKLKFKLRGSDPVASIGFENLGANADGSRTEPLPLIRSNDTEIPQQVTIKFSNVDNDYQDGAESSDRLLVSGDAVELNEVPLGMTSAEAKQMANVLVMDYAASMIRVGPFSLNRSHSALEPTDVVLLLDENGSIYRTRIQKLTGAGGLLTLEGILDDATILSSNALTAGGYNSSSFVVRTAATSAEFLDIPILRDSDNSAGFYIAAKGNRGAWRGAVVYASDDGSTYSKVSTITEPAVTGVTASILGDWAGGDVFDELNTLVVRTDSGELSSVSRQAIINTNVNALLVGSEIIQFRDATLSSDGTYELSGFLRGCKGTEWATALHTISDRVVLLTTSGIRRISEDTHLIGVARYYKVVTLGGSLSATDPITFTDTGVGLKPYAPVDLRGSRSSGDITLTWKRRTRLGTRLTGSAGIYVPLGEASESYTVQIYDSNTFSTVVRTISGLSSASATYTSAQQTTDFGSSQSTIYVRVYQRSEVVGLGYPLEAAA